MDFDKPKVYGDTFIYDGLVYFFIAPVQLYQIFCYETLRLALSDKSPLVHSGYQNIVDFTFLQCARYSVSILFFVGVVAFLVLIHSFPPSRTIIMRPCMLWVSHCY